MLLHTAVLKIHLVSFTTPPNVRMLLNPVYPHWESNQHSKCQKGYVTLKIALQSEEIADLEHQQASFVAVKTEAGRKPTMGKPIPFPSPSLTIVQILSTAGEF